MPTKYKGIKISHSHCHSLNMNLLSILNSNIQVYNSHVLCIMYIDTRVPVDLLTHIIISIQNLKCKNTAYYLLFTRIEVTYDKNKNLALFTILIIYYSDML